MFYHEFKLILIINYSILLYMVASTGNGTFSVFLAVLQGLTISYLVYLDWSLLHSRLVWKISTGESGQPCLLLGIGTLVKVYIVTVVCVWQSVISALNKGYHLSRDYVVPNKVKIHHIQCQKVQSTYWYRGTSACFH